MMLLQQNGLLHEGSFEEIIEQSGPRVVERIDSSPELYKRLENFYYDCTHENLLMEKCFDFAMNSESDTDYLLQGLFDDGF